MPECAIILRMLQLRSSSDPGLLAPRRQQLAQPSPRAMDPALDGPDRAPADLRRFLVAQSGGADENECFPLLRWQRAERGEKLAEFQPACLVWLRCQRCGMAAVTVLDLAPALPVFGAIDVAQDGNEPGDH